ncbi:NAD-dependent epimerase/dehydratase family protein [Denitromonas halophila]|uniref:NAD-dependent epimerase/dehydratase family protein n=1 Tax=Denitromonas halophila TaxID=1629404 RepID=A0A557QN78_9RHOO|nr:NAD-dependent epimerase/dehydratase family protein [Denitromonas halophila]TVO54374.1 NAD-dependent epimerase/dehydratase family protein [Denitromonas halophila]
MTASNIVLTGATGFIGQHFVQAAQGRAVSALTRGLKDRSGAPDNIRWVTGDLVSPGSWASLLTPGCTVINLAYPESLSSEQSLGAAQAMVRACAEANAARLIHCSTVSVYGRTSGGMIDETTPCNPLDEYGGRKLAIEEAIRASDSGACEVAVLRPAAVFGAGGQNLVALANSLCGGAALANYLRASLFGRRRMHLVPVQTVVAALLFLADCERPIGGEVFNVSDDDDALNNFRDVERILAEALEIPARKLPVLPIPSVVLKSLLHLRGRSERDPHCVYRADKIRQLGFVSPIDFEAALRSFAMLCRSDRIVRGRP